MGRTDKPRRMRAGSEVGLFLLIVVLLSTALFIYEWSKNSRTAKDVQTGSQPVQEQQTEAGFAAHFIDVGQGDCELLVCGNEAMLIDAGEAFAAESVIKYIRSLGISELTYVVATHPHSDHIGGLPAVIDEFPVKNFITPDIIHTTKTFENLLDALERKDMEITAPLPFDEYRLGDAALTVVWPEEREFKDINNYSVVIKADYGGTSFLFTGDVESDAEKGILEAGADVKSNVLKIAHHGSRSSTTDAFLNSVSPDLAVISCGFDNTYGHPHKETLDKLGKKNIELYQTHINGTIVIESDGKNLTAKTEK